MTQPSEKLFEEVLADARTKADRIRLRGERDAEAVRERAAQQAKAAADKILAEADAEADLKRTQILATLEIEAQRERLARLEESLQKVYGRVLADLGALDAARRLVVQARLAVEAAAQIPQDELELALPGAAHAERGQALADDVARRVAEQLHRNVTIHPAAGPAEIDDGVIVRTPDGRMEIVNSLEERLRRLWPELRLQVAGRLFPELLKHKET